MVKLAILFPQPADEADFEAHYNHSISLLEKMPGVVRRQACVVLGSPAGKSPYYRILEFYFESYALLDQALRSAEGRTAGAALMGLARNAELIFADVFED